MIGVLEAGIIPDSRELARSKILSGVPLGRYPTASEIADSVTSWRAPGRRLLERAVSAIDQDAVRSVIR
jgi:hypothetical protein